MNCKHFYFSNIGFSLLELLTVVAITSILLTLATPAISGFTSPAGRKGAVTIVMNTLEQGRVSAIETGRDTVVLFWKKNGASSSQPDEPDALMVLRRNEADDAWESTTRWIKLPTGVLFHGEDSGSAILTSSITLTLPSLPGNPASTQLRALHFTSSGAVKSPSGSSTGLYIAFTEGQRDTSGSVVVKKQKSGGHEVISLARYTGRSTMDIVDLQ